MKLRSAWLSALVLLSALLCACSRGGSGASAGAGPTKVKLALNWVPEPEFGGFYAAREGGAYKAENLEVEIMGGGAGVPGGPRGATAQGECASAGADAGSTARARGADVIPLFATYQTSPQGIMAHASRGAKSIGDVLAGGTVALEPGLPYAGFLKKKYGFEKAKVVPYDGGVARFLADKDHAQQCYVTSEPLAAKKQGGDPQVFLVADEGFNPYIGVVIARGALHREKPELVRAFVRSIRAGWRAYLDDPGPANAVMAKLNASMDGATFAAAAEAQKPLIETDETKKRGLGAMTKERWETLTKQLADLGVVERVAPVDYLVDMP